MSAHNTVPIMEDGHNFFKVSQTRAYVDKSLLIENVLKHGSRLLITAPSKFCKSTNLHMMKCFLSDRSDRAKCEIFKTLNIYKRSKRFYKQHIHKYKVVFLDFTSGKSASYSDALDACRWAIHNTFLEHDYLLGTSGIETSEEKIFLSWCDMNRGYKTKQKEDMANDLSMLVEVLARQSGNKVIVLVDEYDSLINKAVYEGPDSDIDTTLQLTSAILWSLLADNTNVKLSIVCGKISTAGYASDYLIEKCNLKIFPFLDNHEFCKFYGLLEDELIQMLERTDFRTSVTNKKLLIYCYGGYTSFKGDKLLNLFSVLKFLKNGKVLPSNCNVYGYTEKLLQLSKELSFSRIIHQLLLRNDLTFSLFKHSNLSQVERITFISQGLAKISAIGCIVHHFFEVGLLRLTFLDRVGCLNDLPTVHVKLLLPNHHVYSLMSHLFQSFAIQNCEFPTRYYNPSDYMKFAEKCQESGIRQWNAIFIEDTF